MNPPELPRRTFTAVGGARIGWVNASWPFARLSLEQGRLRIRVWLLGDYQFAPDEIVAIAPLRKFGGLGGGVQIHHSKPDYPQFITFWSNPNGILKGLEAVGFPVKDFAAPSTSRRGIPLRWSAIVVFVAVWNGLFFGDFIRGAHDHSFPGLLIVFALVLAFGTSVGTLSNRRVQHLVLKPNRHVGEIAPFLRLQAYITGLSIIPFTFIWLAGGFGPLTGFSHASPQQEVSRSLNDPHSIDRATTD